MGIVDTIFSALFGSAPTVNSELVEQVSKDMSIRHKLVNSHDVQSVKEDIGKQLRSKRKKLGYSQEAMAEIANICRDTVYRIENGKCEEKGPYVVEYIRYLVALKCFFVSKSVNDEELIVLLNEVRELLKKALVVIDKMVDHLNKR